MIKVAILFYTGWLGGCYSVGCGGIVGFDSRSFYWGGVVLLVIVCGMDYKGLGV